jgi:hypothetical protein
LAGAEESVSARAAALISLEKPYAFLVDTMMDMYAKGSTLRLSRSYVPNAALDLDAEGFTYDKAATLIAFLQRGQRPRGFCQGRRVSRGHPGGPGVCSQYGRSRH